MKNLRKILAVVLVVCMAFSLMAVASAKNLADYTDASTVTSKEAVDVVSALGLMTGDGSGTWNPTATFTREQAAKVVSSMLSAYAGQFTVTASSFTDVAASRWSAPYIEYAVSKGILSGYGDGKFGPTDPVTASQFAVMILKAIGWGKNNEFASNWEVTAIDKGLELGILSGTANFSAPATREQVAQYVLNSLNIVFQVYSKDTESYKDTNPVVSFATKLGVSTVIGIVTANASTGTTGTDIKTFTTTAGLIDDIANAAVNYKIATTNAQIGQIVKIYYKTAATALAVVQLSTAKTVTALVDTAAKYTAAFGTAVDAAATLDFTATTFANTEAAMTGFTASTDAAVGTYAIYNNEVVTYVPNAVYKISQVAGYTAPTATTTGSVTITGLKNDGTEGAAAAITLQKLGSTTANIINVYAGIAVGDYVYIDRPGSAPIALSKATAVTSSLSAVTATTATINGAASAISTVADLASLTNVAVGAVGTTQRVFVFDKAGAVAGYAAVTTVSTADTYGVVLATSYTAAVTPAIGNGFVGTYGYATVYVLKADGTKVVYKWNDTGDTTYVATGNAGGTVNAHFNTAFGLDANTNGTVDAGESLAVNNVLKFAATSGLALTACERQAATAGATITAGSALTSVASTYYTASTVFVYMNTAAVTNTASAVTGYANAQAAVATHVTLVASNGFVVFAFVDQAYALAPTTENVAYFRSNTYSVAQYDATLATTIYGYTAYINGVATTLWSTNNALAPSVGEFSKYTLTSGMLTAVANPTGTEFASQTVNFKDATNLIVGAVQVTYANAQVITYSASAMTVTAGGTISVGSVVSGVYSATNDLLYVVVEVA